MKIPKSYLGSTLGLSEGKKNELWLISEIRKTTKFSYIDHKMFRMSLYSKYRKSH